MNMTGISRRLTLKLPALSIVATAILAAMATGADPLPSWNDTTQKQVIISFVEKVTKEGTADFVPERSRSGQSSQGTSDQTSCDPRFRQRTVRVAMMRQGGKAGPVE